jgi:hypothetical protein
MTPLYNRLSRFLTPAITRVAMVVIYAVLMVMITAVLIPPQHFELVYLDLGR